eukprot:5926189-Amphidinium_carterae.6
MCCCELAYSFLGSLAGLEQRYHFVVMSSVSGTSAARGLPAVDSDVILPYESSASRAPPRKRESSRMKPGAGRRNKSALRVSIGRKTKIVSAGRDIASASSVPNRAIAHGDRDVLKLESTVMRVGEAWQELNLRAAQTMAYRGCEERAQSS